MADEEQVRAAVVELVDRLASVDDTMRARIPEGSVSVLVPDLGRGFHARLEAGRFTDVTELEAGDLPDTDLHLVASSDELVALVSGELSFPRAWATGRIRVQAGIGVLLQLRRFL